MGSRVRSLRRSLERGGPVAVAVLLGAALVVSSALSYRDAHLATQALTERHGMHVFRRVRMEIGEGAPTHETLARALEASRDLGLRYVAVYREAEAGLAAGQTAAPGVPPAVFQLVTVGGRVRMAAPLARGPRLVHARDRAPDGPAGPTLLIEFEPVETQDLTRRALLNLWLSSGAALLLTSAALVLWRAGRRAQRMEAELEAQRHLATLGSLSAVLAHEIRNPLASLKGHAQLLAEKAEDPKREARVRRVVDEALRLEALTNDLLEFARSGAVRPVPSSPAAVLDQAVAATAPDRIEKQAAGAPPSWPLDPGRLQQVLINLLENALAVTPAGEAVTAAIAEEAGALVFSVRDRGPGVPASERARIFEPFHTTKLRGTGLGLAVSKRIVELHGGRIEVTDAPGGGALFRVRLPRPA